MSYVDVFVMSVYPDRWDEHVEQSRQGAAIWKGLGALSVVDTRADDAPVGEVTSFPRAVMAKEGEILALSYITYRDRAHRDQVMAAAMKHEGFMEMMKSPPFNPKLMIWGGFETLATD